MLYSRSRYQFPNAGVRKTRLSQSEEAAILQKRHQQQLLVPSYLGLSRTKISQYQFPNAGVRKTRLSQSEEAAILQKRHQQQLLVPSYLGLSRTKISQYKGIADKPRPKTTRYKGIADKPRPKTTSGSQIQEKQQSWLDKQISSFSKQTLKTIWNAIKFIVTSTKKSNTENRTTKGYQEYTLKEGFVLVNLNVKDSRNVPFSFLQYYVEIVYPRSPLPGKTRRETSKILALRSPIWNETLSFLVREKDWNRRTDLNIECKLVTIDYLGNTHWRMVKICMAELSESKILEFDMYDDSVYKSYFFHHFNLLSTQKYKLKIKINIDVEIQRETDVHIRNEPELCQSEQAFVDMRQRIVMKQMIDKLHLKNISNVHDVPNIAIIGSGGGMRAVIGMCGAITALQDEGILDSTVYIAGLSGSAWYLMTLYVSNAQLNPKAVNKSIRQKLGNNNAMQLRKAWYSWRYHTQSNVFNHGKYFTITDTFGEMIGSILLGKKCKQTWSEQRKKLDNGSAPLPLLAALHVRDEESIENYHDWVEFSPYEAYIPKYGAGVDMKNFGDNFYGGFVIKEYDEQPIHFLAGMCGSAYAKAKKDKQSGNTFCRWIKELIHSWFNIFENRFVGTVPNWLRGIQLVNKSTGQEATDDHTDSKKESIMLADAGIAFNSPYPLVLNPARKVDVILSFDFTDRGDDTKWPFEELVKAEKWAHERNIPFPKLTLPPKTAITFDEMYIFKSANAPTILHFVMVNDRFRKQCHNKDSRQHDFDILPDYSTFRFTYSDKEFDKLKSLIEFNVWNNKTKIVQCIQDAINTKVEKTLFHRCVRKIAMRFRQLDSISKRRSQLNCV